MEQVHLSPCVQSAISSLSEVVTGWEFCKYLLGIHPEYTEGKLHTLIPDIDKAYQGEKKPISAWLELIRERYPREDLLHTKLVVLGLYYVDPELQDLIPKEIASDLESEIIFK